MCGNMQSIVPFEFRYHDCSVALMVWWLQCVATLLYFRCGESLFRIQSMRHCFGWILQLGLDGCIVTLPHHEAVQLNYNAVKLMARFILLEESAKYA